MALKDVQLKKKAASNIFKMLNFLKLYLTEIICKIYNINYVYRKYREDKKVFDFNFFSTFDLIMLLLRFQTSLNMTSLIETC